MATDGELAFYKESQFPNLAKTGYLVTSSQTATYNCFAWAAVQDDRWWSPGESGTGASYYWIDGVPDELTIAAFVQAYETLGYSIVLLGGEAIIMLSKTSFFYLLDDRVGSVAPAENRLW